MIQPMCQLSLMLKEVFWANKECHQHSSIHPPSRLQPDDLHCCFSAPVEKDCILCKQGEISGLVTDTKAQVVSFVSFAAAAFAAASALAFPVEIKLLSLVCAAHLQIATLSGKIMASKSHKRCV